VTVKGDDVMALHAALTAPVGEKPRAIIMDSVKGAGVPDVENTFGNHSMSPSKDTCDKWLAELRAELAAME
jgi:transketolase